MAWQRISQISIIQLFYIIESIDLKTSYFQITSYSIRLRISLSVVYNRPRFSLPLFYQGGYSLQ